ncbi:MAG: histidine--tRNA ligase [Nanoarchaeota archaeon]
MTLEVLKGCSDSLPAEQIQINRILDIIRNNFEKYGFRPFDTPTIEYLDVLARKYDEDAEIVQEIFKVTDRGNRKLGLRYDLTTPLSRYVASQKQLKLPFRRYAIGKVFRDGPIKKGRVREFIQCDGDVIGITGIEIEAEILEMFFNTYKELGIDVVIEVNNNKILRGALLQENFKEKELDSLILSIDKLKKIGLKGVLDEIKGKGLETKRAENAIKILQSKDFKEIKKLAKSELLKEGIAELEELTNLLNSLKVVFRVNFSMSRGLAIYSGNIWEAYEKDERVTSSIGAGGRFDKIIGEYSGDGREFPAVGVSFGLVPILACLNEEKREGTAEILVVPLSEGLTKDALKLANKLRKKENVEICYDYKLKKAFSYAQYLGIQKIAILGEKDKEQGVYTLKDIDSGKEEKVKL